MKNNLHWKDFSLSCLTDKLLQLSIIHHSTQSTLRSGFGFGHRLSKEHHPLRSPLLDCHGRHWSKQIVQIIEEGLWMSYVVQSTWQMECKAVLQAARVLIAIFMLFGGFRILFGAVWEIVSILCWKKGKLQYLRRYCFRNSLSKYSCLGVYTVLLDNQLYHSCFFQPNYDQS